MGELAIAQGREKNHRAKVNAIEEHSLLVVSGKVSASEGERRLCVKYLLELDLLRKRQRFAAVDARRKKLALKHKAAIKAGLKEVEDKATEAAITPELEQRLAALEGV